ncbi:hypothetical protein MMC07_006719 [Pseudocyphellaria aurata]|nr:hypothetical protein [Pseudocyphellaria aurata]
MSNSTSSLLTSKNGNVTSQNPSPSQSQSASSFIGAESYPQRRGGGSGSFGAGASSRTTPFAARNNQSVRKQHKGQRRPRLADEDAAAESAAMQSASSRKGQTSITHLMNFTLPPRPHLHQPSHFSRNARKNPTWGVGSGYHAIDKAKYVHANYRFIVDPRGDYRAQAMDADVHLDWDSVVQILVSAQSQLTSCPICLSTPVAPRMAKCGHIFCLPCLIRYMHSTDEEKIVPEKKARWKKCPICWDSVYSSETRPVRWFAGQEGAAPREGCDVVLRLISRQQGSTLALPRDGAEALNRADDIPWYFAAEVMDYARVMKGSEDYMAKQYEEEIKALQQQEREDELFFGEETLWTRKAVSLILDAQNKLTGMGNPSSTPQQPVEKKTKRALIQFHETMEDVPDYCLVQHAEKSGHSSFGGHATPQSQLPPKKAKDDAVTSQDDDPTSASVFLTGSDSVRGSPSLSQHQAASTSRALHHVQARSIATYDSPFYFYEALLHYYLSPLDIRILKTAFGDFSSFPSTILPRVERVSTGHIVDDELRRRAKYLAHLPQGCEVGFLECDWTDVVAPEVLCGFAAEIERRRKKNQEKEVHEEKERVRAEKEEDEKRWAAARRKKPSVLHENSPDTDVQPLPLLVDRLESPSITEIATGSSPPWTFSRIHGGSAFATLASPSTSPVAPRTVWGTTAVAPTVSPTLPSTSIEHEPSDNDGWLQDWEQDLLQEDDLVARFEGNSISNTDAKAGMTGTSNKRKKSKKITLMTTNARRGA